MNNYSAEYSIGEDFHLRSCTRVQYALNKVGDLYADKITSIKIGEYEGDEGFIELMYHLFQNKLKAGGKIKINLEGDLEKDVLKECADELGAAFEFNPLLSSNKTKV